MSEPRTQPRTLSVVMPCYHEEPTLAEIVSRVLAADRCGLDLELLIVDDGSTRDSTAQIAESLASQHPEIVLVRHPHNQGKGAALASGIAAARGDIILIQDADLEYDPRDYPKLLAPILDGRAQVVLGSRFVRSPEQRVQQFWHARVNQLLTLAANCVSNLYLTDMETCYKVFTADLIKSIPIEEKRFGFEPEIVCKIAQTGCPVYEVAITYHGRSADEGKKIGWRDGVRALYAIVKYGIVRRRAFRRQAAKRSARLQDPVENPGGARSATPQRQAAPAPR